MVVKISNKKLDQILPLINKDTHLKETFHNCIKFKLGTAWMDNSISPAVVIYITPGFCYVNGNQNSSVIVSLLKKIPEKHIIIIPDQKWEDVLKQFWKNTLYMFQRTGFSSKNLVLEHLKDLKTTFPKEFEIKRVTLEIAKKLDKKIAPMMISMFGKADNFIKTGVGFCAMDKGTSKVVCMASSFTPFDKILEVQIDTINDPRYRQKGLATATSAYLLEYCLKNNILPHWDAANDISCRLALKLGFTDPVTYTCYFWSKRANI